MHQDMPSYLLHFLTSHPLAHRRSASALLSYAGCKSFICVWSEIAMAIALAAQRLCARHKIGPFAPKHGLQCLFSHLLFPALHVWPVLQYQLLSRLNPQRLAMCPGSVAVKQMIEFFGRKGRDMCQSDVIPAVTDFPKCFKCLSLLLKCF